MFKFFNNFLSTQVENNNQLEEISDKLDNVTKSNKELVNQIKKLRSLESQCYSHKELYSLLLKNESVLDEPISYSECSFVRENDLKFFNEEKLSDLLDSVVIPFQDSMFDLEMVRYRHYSVDMYFINASQETAIRVIQTKREQDPYHIGKGTPKLEISITAISMCKEIDFEERFYQIFKEFSFEEMQSFYRKAYNEPEVSFGAKNQATTEVKEKLEKQENPETTSTIEEPGLKEEVVMVEDKEENLLEDLSKKLNLLIQDPDSDELKTNFRKAATKAMREVNSKK